MDDLDYSISSQQDIASTGFAGMDRDIGSEASVGSGHGIGARISAGACACGGAGVGEGSGACGDAGACACADWGGDVSGVGHREDVAEATGESRTSVSRETGGAEGGKQTDVSRETVAETATETSRGVPREAASETPRETAPETPRETAFAASAGSAADGGDSPSFDTFIFDLDGTLLDTLPDLVVLTNAVLRESGFPERTTAEILGFVGNGVKALMYQAVPKDAGDAEVEEAMKRWKEQYPDYGHQLTQPYPGIPEAVAELKRRGVKLGVLSNKFDGAVCEVIDAYLPDLFTITHGECDAIPRKPNPAGLLRTISELGSTLEHTVYVGDSAGDVAVARNAGTHVIGVTWGYHGRVRLSEAGADAVIDHPRELLAYASR